MSGSPYIVVFKDNVTKEQIDKYIKEVEKNGGELKTRFDENGGILNVCQAIYMTLKDANEAAPSQGFAAKIPDSYLQSLQSFTDDVAYIEPDSVVTTQ
ncbi:hypothetical protein CVT25_008530 [Psilocybe cyanescens]|uniref:Inhibitor I9 domain-containing protein n=1 Tax=Psilocybe cyanescens TaxID=93625 RepID=A0A409XNL9_PSICY|nr:hypothetical protein CVT25_008530 [Psilocybe cyanescens]